MSNLDISPNIFTHNGSLYFKNMIVDTKLQIPNYSTEQLNVILNDLINRRTQMTHAIESGGMYYGGSFKTFTIHEIASYKTYLDDVKDIITLVENRLNSGQGIKRKSSKRKRKSMRYIKNKRKSRKYKRY
jgi:hypothetical protein